MKKGTEIQLKIVFSLVSVVVGWVASICVFSLYEFIISGWKWPPHNLESFVLWSGLFTFMGWNLFCLPLVVVLESLKVKIPPKKIPWIGAGYSVFVYGLLVAWWSGLWRDVFTFVLAGVLGFTAGLFYSLSYLKFGKEETPPKTP